MEKINHLELLNELSEYINLRVKSFLELAHDHDWIEHKAHLDYDLWLIRSGVVRITINGKVHYAAAGDIVFFYPGVPYMAATDVHGCRFLYVHFDFGIGQQQRILDDFRLSGVVPGNLIISESALLAKAFEQAKHQSSMPGNRLYLKACLTTVIAKILELYGQQHYSGHFLLDGTPRATRSLDVLQPVFHYVNAHLHQAIRMRELADLVGISEKYFISYFKKALGITPGQYIYQIKMNRARELLYERQHAIAHIATLLGYPDLFTFSKAFKKYYGVPPSRFE